MIHTDEDDEFNRIERESKQRMEAVYQEVQRRNKAMEKEYVRPWVGLTEEEKHSAAWSNGEFGDGVLWAEKLLKERNT
jgi:hypothetical protein